MNKTIGIVGLGRVGKEVARGYLAKGYKVMGYDIDNEANSFLESLGGKVGDSPQKIADSSDILLILVLNDEQVHEVIESIKKTSNKNLIVICMSTINRSNLENAAASCASIGLRFIDCPFTGGPARVATGRLTLIAAGESSSIDMIDTDLDVIGNITRAGEKPGLGQAVKHCNQLLVGTTQAATMEVIALSRRLGLDPKLVCSVVGSGIAGSDYFRLLAESVLDGKPSPGGLGQMCKDMAIVANTTKEVGLPANAANAAAKYFEKAAKLGMQDRESADLIEVVEG
ncbi:MAG: NAD(P)-dependent oxidoreductase [Bacteroidetes bacterium]|nr:NAD(P)-dependent oxidoreductase [Bacteroidota bacterium]MDA1118986.1 NAD(P)-dependent oxidoreductase [Bacteroidota bacterium]